MLPTSPRSSTSPQPVRQAVMGTCLVVLVAAVVTVASSFLFPFALALLLGGLAFFATRSLTRIDGSSCCKCFRWWSSSNTPDTSNRGVVPGPSSGGHVFRIDVPAANTNNRGVVSNPSVVSAPQTGARVIPGRGHTSSHVDNASGHVEEGARPIVGGGHGGQP